LNTTCWPAWIGEMSTSMDARAYVAADGFIWSMKGHAVAARPTTAMPPDAT
jgi:hypothetical protein